MRLLVMLTALLLGLALGCSSPEKEAKVHFLEGQQAMVHSKYGEALKQFELAYSKDSTLLDALFQFAQVKAAIEDYDGAFVVLRKLRLKQYKVDTVYYSLAKCLLSKADQSVFEADQVQQDSLKTTVPPPPTDSLFIKAVALLDTSIQFNMHLLDAYYLKARAQYRAYMYHEAMLTTRILMKLDDTQYAYYVLRGDLRVRLGDERGGAEDYEKVVMANVKDSSTLALAYHSRGLLHRENKEFYKALADLTEAIELSPKSAPQYMARGKVYMDLRDTIRACGDFRKAADLGYTAAYACIKEFSR